MKEQIKLFKKLVLIIVPLLVLIFLFEVKARELQNGFKLKKFFLEKDIDSIKILILGSSHGYFSLNPEIINNNSFNLAYFSQDLYYDSKLFDKYKSSLKNLKCIVLSLSYFSLWYDVNETPEKWRKYFYKEYYKINPKNSLSISDILDVKSYSFAFFYRFDNTLLGAINSKLLSNGSKMNVSGWNTDTLDYSVDSTEIGIIKGKERVYFTNSLINKDNFKKNAEYLDEIIKYANENNIKVVFITTPVSYPYSHFVDNKNYNEFQNEVNKYTRYKNILYLNYFNDKRFTMRDYYDYDHLNGIGAVKFSKIIRDTMQVLNLYK